MHKTRPARLNERFVHALLVLAAFALFAAPSLAQSPPNVVMVVFDDMGVDYVGAYGEASADTGVNGNQADNSALGAGAVYVYELE